MAWIQVCPLLALDHHCGNGWCRAVGARKSQPLDQPAGARQEKTIRAGGGWIAEVAKWGAMATRNRARREQVEARFSCFHQTLGPVKTQAAGRAQRALIGHIGPASIPYVRACWCCSAWSSSRWGTAMNKAFRPSVMVGC